MSTTPPSPRTSVLGPGALDGTAGAVAAAVTSSDRVSRSDLPRVLHDATAALVMLDTSSGRVTYGNPAARELADLPLPALAADWAEAAGLRAPRGAANPLEAAARGEAVNGAPLVQHAVEDSPGRVLWLTAFPLPRIAGLNQAALVVLLPVDHGSADVIADDLHLRALVAAGLSFTISDPHLEDNPLVWVNPAFTAMTGYSEEELLGRNCRFLQGPDTDPEAVARLRAGIQARQVCQEVLLNHRKDGTAFWSEVSVSPVFDGEGNLTHYVGVQADVTARVEAQLEREAHLSAERTARAEAERVQARLELLADATEGLVATLDVEEALGRLADVVVPRLADWCVVDLVVDEDGRGTHQVVSRHVDPQAGPDLARVERLQPRGLLPDAPIRRVIDSGEPLLLRDVAGLDTSGHATEELLAAYAALGLASAIVVPLVGRNEVLGTLLLGRGDGGRSAYDEEDLRLAIDLSRRAALIVDNARLYNREHRTAEALQRSMLPVLPAVPGLDIAARYLPGGVGAAVGGDWYDLLQLPDGTVGVAIGDVMGHDMAAAAAMGQLRSVLRSYAWQRQNPAQVLDSLDQLVQGLDMAQLATTVFARIVFDEDPDSQHVTLDYANAGHLPPMVRLPDGRVEQLNEGWSVLIGAPGGAPRAQARVRLPVGSTLLMVTDGLVEVRGEDIELGLKRLEHALGESAARTAEELCDELVRALRADEREDDTALLAVRLIGAAPGTSAAGRNTEPSTGAATLVGVREVLLPAEPASARVARRVIRAALGGLQDLAEVELVESAVLLTTELVGNAITHGAGDVGLRVEVGDRRVRVEVDDADPRLPVRREQQLEGGLPGENGRGIFLVEAIADRWGAEQVGAGKRVWFELDRASTPR
ncbi:MAG: SpoIIE family protein phosphatase [Motilibacteraceae bacterium]